MLYSSEKRKELMGYLIQIYVRENKGFVLNKIIFL